MQNVLHAKSCIYRTIKTTVGVACIQILSTSLLVAGGLEGLASTSKASFELHGSTIKSNVLSGKVKGTVTEDQTTDPLVGVTITIKGQTRVIQTDSSGQFELELAEGSYELSARYIGYSTEVLTVKVTGGKTTALKFNLKPSSSSLNDVMIIGYGKNTKKELTTAISRVNVKDIAPRNVSAANQLIQGQVAGVNLSIANGTPGSASRVSIRGISSINGDNEPLYVIDGIPLSKDLASYNYSGEYRQDPLSLINPSDIESIDILKDAAASAIYGSRATNGVIIITTKQGKSGAPRITVSQLSGLQTMPKKLNLLNPQEYIAMQTAATNTFNADMGYTAGQTGYIDLASVLGKVPENPVDINWQDLIINDPAATHQTDFSFSGGNDKTTHYTSGGYQYQEGLIKQSSLKRYSLRNNIEFKPNQTFTLGLRLAGNYTQSTSIPNGDQGTALFQRSLEQRPYDSPYLANGDFAVGGKDILRHNALIILEKDETTDKNLQGLVNLYGDINFLKHFTWHSGYNAEVRMGTGHRRQKLTHPYNSKGYVNDIRSNRYSSTLDNTLNYKNSWNGLEVDVMAGHSFYRNKYNFNQATGTEFPSDDFKHITSATIKVSNGDATEYSIESYLSRISLNYKGTYFLSASARRDGSSKFSKENRFATSPSLSAGWVLTNEKFLKETDWLEFAKLRVSWGKTGNQDGIGNFTYLPLASGGYNYNLQTGLSVTSLGNSALKWETATQTNFGLDLSFLRGRLELTYDYFIKETNDLLYNLPVLRTSGFTTITSNIGSMENRGHEITLNSVNVDHSGFRWSTNFNIALIRNKVLSLLGNDPIAVGGWNAIIPGEALGVFYGYQQLGIYQDMSEIPQALQVVGVRPGDIKYADLDNNDIINASDRMKIGSSQADFTGGLTNNFKVGNFDLSIFNTFSVGNDIAAGWRTGLDHLGASSYGAFKDNYDNRWTAPGTSNTIPRVTKSTHNIKNSSYFIEDASFFRLKNITLGYQLPQNLTKKLKVSGIRVFTSVSNIFTFTNYSGYDPEASMGLDARSYGVDNLVTPQPRSFMMGLNVNF